MNKGFFVVFLAIVTGAMALIFFNQASDPATVNPGVRHVASSESGAQAPASEPETREPAVVAEQRAVTQPEPAQPAPTKPEPVKPAMPRPEPSKPEPVQPEAPKPEAAKPEPVKPEAVQPEPQAKPEPSKPEPVKPEPPKPEPAQAAPAVPVTAKPETPSPAEQVKKSLTLRNMGLHFRGNGMVLRIEADGAFSYKIFALPSPDRYVVDLVGDWKNMRSPSVPSNTMVSGVRLGKQAGGPRLVLDMQRPPKKHTVTWVSANVLEIYIE